MMPSHPSDSQPPDSQQHLSDHEAERARILATLVGNLTHDLNNLLTVVTCNTDLLLLEGGQDHRQQSMLREIAHAAGQAADLTAALQAFSRRTPTSPGRCNVVDTLDEILRLLRHALPKNVEFAIECENAPPDAWVDAGQLKFALLILCARAGLAMPLGGRLSLSVSSRRGVTRAAPQQGDHTDYVVFCVEHSGNRLDELGSTQQTGADYRRHGDSADHPAVELLGLNVVREIAGQNGGWLDASESTDETHRYQFLCPIAKSDERLPSRPAPGQGGAVLVAEVDPMRVALLVGALDQGGYTPITIDRVDAIGQAIAVTNDPLRAAILGQLGSAYPIETLAREIRSSCPGVPIIQLCRADSPSGSSISPPVVPLDEPFGAAEILSAVRQAVEDASPVR